MGLKGSARIELTNADGTKEVVEHGNMITGAVRDLVYASRGEQSNIMRIANNGESYVEQIFGGILLFKEPLSSDPEDYYIPSINTTGYASATAYGGLDAERGSFNAIESGLQEDGSYKLVWDFATSQANGVIQSLGLCPNMMGRIGMSSTAVSGEKISATTSRSCIAPFNTSNMGNMLPSSGSTEGLSNYGYNIVAVIGNIAYAIHRDNLNCEASTGIKKNGGILKLHRFNIGVSGIGLCNKVGLATYIDCIDVQLPTDYISDLGTDDFSVDYSYDEASKMLILYHCYYNTLTFKQNATMKYVEIDISNNMNVTLRNFTNNAPGYIFLVGVSAFSDYGAYQTIFIAKDYIVFQAVVGSGKEKLYVESKSDNTDIKEVKFLNGNEFFISFSDSYARESYFRPVFTFGNFLVFGYTGDLSNTYFQKVFILDMSTGLLKETNAKEMTYRSNVPLDNKVTWGRTGTYLALSISVNPFVLTTKNNLDEPVTKTASQTMKITYTLTETAESGV